MVLSAKQRTLNATQGAAMGQPPVMKYTNTINIHKTYFPLSINQLSHASVLCQNGKTYRNFFYLTSSLIWYSGAGGDWKRGSGQSGTK